MAGKYDIQMHRNKPVEKYIMIEKGEMATFFINNGLTQVTEIHFLLAICRCISQAPAVHLILYKGMCGIHHIHLLFTVSTGDLNGIQLTYYLPCEIVKFLQR